MITKYMGYCIICAKPKDDIHHCFKGNKQRHLADEDKLVIPVCRECHEKIHKQKELNVLVEIIGQLEWEKNHIIKTTELPFDDLAEEAREAFRFRYSRSYL